MPSFRAACRGRSWALPGTRLWATEEPEGHRHAGQVASRHGADRKAGWDGGLQSESPGLLSLLSQLPRQETSWLPSFPIREMVQTVERVTANTQVFTGEGLTF